MLLDFILSVIRSLPAAVSQGILWGLITLGVYISFRLLNMADMTVDGSFAAGGAVTAVLITHGMDPYFDFCIYRRIALWTDDWIYDNKDAHQCTSCRYFESDCIVLH